MFWLIAASKVAYFCLWVIEKTNRYCDRRLSQRLFDLAERYNTRPGTFNYNAVEKAQGGKGE